MTDRYTRAFEKLLRVRDLALLRGVDVDAVEQGLVEALLDLERERSHLAQEVSDARIENLLICIVACFLVGFPLLAYAAQTFAIMHGHKPQPLSIWQELAIFIGVLGIVGHRFRGVLTLFKHFFKKGCPPEDQ